MRRRERRGRNTLIAMAIIAAAVLAAAIWNWLTGR
jgi:hypothetical protein